MNDKMLSHSEPTGLNSKGTIFIEGKDSISRDRERRKDAEAAIPYVEDEKFTMDSETCYEMYRLYSLVWMRPIISI